MLRPMHPRHESHLGVLIDVPGMTAEQYEVVASRLGWTGADVSPPDGLVIHVAGPVPHGFRIFDLWRDEASFRLFSTTAVAAAVEGLGLSPYEPQLFPVQHIVS